MAITADSKSEPHHLWGMGQVLLVFFPEGTTTTSSSSAPSTRSSSTATTTTTTIAATTSPFSKPIKRTNSITNPIITKTQSTLSICALLLFFSLLLFTLSTFEPSIPTPTPSRSRRFLSQKSTYNNDNKKLPSWVSRMWSRKLPNIPTKGKSFALQGMGRLFLRGTRAMADLVVAHVVEDTNEADFRLFLRLLHRSGLTARADTVFLFPSHSLQSRFEALIREENDSFLKLVQNYHELVNRTSRDWVSVGGFDVTRFLRSGKKEVGEPLWGKRTPVSNFTESEESEGESTRLSYGSVVGFEASELDPENSLSGFLDHVSMSLRRWACYPMLLGRLRRNFKHIMLVDAKNLVLLRDPLGRVRSQSAESVYISTKQETVSVKHRKDSEKTQSRSQVDSAVLMGGARGVRRFSSAMLTEIVRVAMQHKKKNSVAESGIFNQLVGNGHILKNINLMRSAESIPDSSSLSGSYPNLNSDYNNNYSIIQRSNSNRDLNSIIMKQICSCELDSSVYRDC